MHTPVPPPRGPGAPCGYLHVEHQRRRRQAAASTLIEVEVSRVGGERPLWAMPCLVRPFRNGGARFTK